MDTFLHYLTSGKLKVTSNNVTAEVFTQLQEMMTWICPDINLSDNGVQKQKLKISGIERISTEDFSLKIDINEVDVFESENESNNNNVATDADREDVNDSFPTKKTKKKLMKCEVCGFSKCYAPNHEWRFREHERMCNMKVDEEESFVEMEEVEFVKEQDYVELNCGLCEKTFRNPSTLKNHVILAHFNREIRATYVTPTGEDQNQIKRCHECTYSTKILSSLILHYGGSSHNKLWELAPKEVLDTLPPVKKRRISKHMSIEVKESDEEMMKEEAEFDE